jgi:excinuclease ABC subunit C
VRKRALLREFGSVEKVARTSVDELAKVEGVGKKIAEEIAAYFRK